MGTLRYCAVMLALTGMMAYHLLCVDDSVSKALAHVHVTFLRRVLADTGTITGLTAACSMSFSAMQHRPLTLAKESRIVSAFSRMRILFPCSSQLRCAAIGATLFFLLQATRSPKEKSLMHVFR
ncbi:hypothetical_protein [Leishmania major strain Friedlin]|nr:hypothetical_protein [Leishmania major strain Friedlin]